jgi:hypothetical protein
LPQSSQAQSWTIRPVALQALASNRDSSAISKMLPQRGHFGRLKLRAALARAILGDAWYAAWTIMAISSTYPHRTLARQLTRLVWHDRDGSVKLWWLLGKIWLCGDGFGE